MMAPLHTLSRFCLSSFTKTYLLTKTYDYAQEEEEEFKSRRFAVTEEDRLADKDEDEEVDIKRFCTRRSWTSTSQCQSLRDRRAVQHSRFEDACRRKIKSRCQGGLEQRFLLWLARSLSMTHPWRVIDC